MEDRPQGPRARATFIVRLSREGTTSWHGVVELVGEPRRARVSHPDDLAAFIEAAFDGSSRAPARTPAPQGGTRWN
jgi:hypothetical protein